MQLQRQFILTSSVFSFVCSDVQSPVIFHRHSKSQDLAENFKNMENMFSNACRCSRHHSLSVFKKQKNIYDRFFIPRYLCMPKSQSGLWYPPPPSPHPTPNPPNPAWERINWLSMSRNFKLSPTYQRMLIDWQYQRIQWTISHLRY